MGELLIRIPRTAPRASQQVFAKLLTRIVQNAHRKTPSGFDFEGTFLRPGKLIPESQLWPTPDYPKIPLLLEFAGTFGGRGHKRGQSVFLLWRFDIEQREWVEIARAQSVAWEWALDLGPIAVRALKECRGEPLVKAPPDLRAIESRIAAFLDGELNDLEPQDRGRVLGVLHDQFAFRLVQSEA